MINGRSLFNRLSSNSNKFNCIVPLYHFTHPGSYWSKRHGWSSRRSWGTRM